MSRFVLAGDVTAETFDWGTVRTRLSPPQAGCRSFIVLDAEIVPGGCHAFHKHPDQDEMIIVKSGRIQQWIEEEHTDLGPGDSVYIDRDVVHGSYNDSGEPAVLQVVLAPAAGEGGYELVDVAGEEPWASLR